MSVIVSIGNAVPPYKHHQQDILQFMLQVYQPDENEKRKVEILYKKSGIETRYSPIPDYSRQTKEWLFYPQNETLEPFPLIGERMQIFHQEALPLALNAIGDMHDIHPNISLKNVTHLITVSCTGVAAPGLDITLIKTLNLPKNISRSSVNFMGCYAGFHALKQADYICKADKDAVVLVVCLELCTLHFQKTYDTDNLTANCIFADGAAAVLICSEEKAEKLNSKGMALKGFYAEVEQDGEQDMAWEVSHTGFLMTLSSYIPQLIKKGIEPLVKNALDSLELNHKEIKHWAIHPGGKRILEVIQEQFNLQNQQVEASFETLRNFGNMSSVTIFFVLKYLWENKVDWTQSEHIFSAGFGPGLTLETAVLKTVIEK